MRHHGFRAVLFDFDYTLADSSIGVVDCVNFSLCRLGLPLASAGAIRGTIGLPLKDAFKRLVGPEYLVQFEEFFRLYTERANAVMTDATVLFESVPRTIESLTKLGVALGIVSTKESYRIEAVLERESLLDSFDVIIGGDDVPIPKPDPEGLLTAIRRLGCSPSNSLYVGDSVVDAETARRADVPFAAVLSGMGSREDFKEYEAYRMLDSLLELPDLVTP